MAAACSGGDIAPSEPCGPNGSCPGNLVCDPKENMCRATGNVDLPDASTGSPATTITPQFDPGAPVATATVSFQLSASPGDATFACRIGDAAFAPCASPFVATPGEGTFTLTARATAGGVTEPNPPSVPFTIDLTPPTVTITAPADRATVGAGASLQLSVSEPAATIECAFDGGAFAACGTGRQGATPIPAALADGAHTAWARATDLAGNRGAPASVGFTLDRRALTVTIVPRATPCVGEVIAFSASIAGATFSCDLDGTVTAGCASPFQLPATLAAGMHTLTVTAVDETGNTSQLVQFNQDVPACTLF